MLLALFILSVQVPYRPVQDPGVIATNQRITPAGVQSVFDGRVTGLRFGSRPGEVWAAVGSAAYQLAWRDNRVLKRQSLGGNAGVYGVAIDPVTGRALISTVGRVPAGAPRPPNIRVNASNVTQLLSVAPARDGVAGNDTTRWFGAIGRDMAGGPAVAARANQTGHRVAVLPLPSLNQLAILDADSARLLSTVALGVVPLATVLSTDGATAWVSELGGAAPGATDRAMKQCCEGSAQRVRIDSRGIAMPGTVSRVDLVSGAITASVTVGRHPTALAWDEAHSALYVADGNDDRISVIDTQRGLVVRNIEITPFAQRATGLAPTALALSARGDRLYVTLGGVNAVAVYDVAGRDPALLGLIPTGWYPSTIDISADGRYLAIGTLFGPGSGNGVSHSKTGRYVHAVRGSVAVVEIPAQAQLAAFTTAVAENNRLIPAHSANIAAGTDAGRRTAAPRAVPQHPGDPSLIEHVVYIIRENRTYDQMLGDLGRGDGDPSLVMYGRDVTPNTHALSEQFVTLDRMFASGGNSADGHQWLTQANETEYVMWPLYHGRSYPYDGTDALAYSSGGFIWDAAASRNRSVAVFGEFAPEIPDSGPDMRTRMLNEYRLRQAGTSSPAIPEYHSASAIPSLDRVLVRDFPTWTLGVPDVVRAEIFISYLRRWEAADSMPSLSIMQLPSDHTSGTSGGWCTPKACVADNDLALGQVVDAVSHSKFWATTAIIVVEDDAQDGVDHVDGHRTVALAISPYSRRGTVDSTFYNAPSILKTIELMLGLPSLSMFDLVASDMGNSFIGPDEKPDFSPYTAVLPVQSIHDVNPRPNDLPRGPQRDGALASAKMRFDIPDAAPSDRLNRILWNDAHGWKTPYPDVRTSLFLPMSVDVDDDDREEAREAAQKKMRGGH